MHSNTSNGSRHLSTGAIAVIAAWPALCRAQCPDVWLPIRQAYAGTAQNVAVWNGPTGTGPDRLVVADSMLLSMEDEQGWHSIQLGGVGPQYPFTKGLAAYQNSLYVGGWFREIDHKQIFSIARWDGSRWSGLGQGLTVSDTSYVYAMTVYDGRLVVAGSFVVGVAGNIATWDGNAWGALGPGLSGPAVQALTVYRGDLIAAGRILQSNTVPITPIHRVGRFDGTAWHDMGFPNVNYSQGGMLALAVYNDELILGGYFNVALPGGAGVAHSIARWDGAQWRPLGDGINGTVQGMTVFNGELIVCGYVAEPDGARVDVAAWNGTSWRPVGPGLRTLTWMAR